MILYRVGRHVDISRGPMIASTALLGKCTISAVHRVADEAEVGAFYRVQGVALPVGFIINHFAYSILEDRSRKLVNNCWICRDDSYMVNIYFYFCIRRIQHVCPMNRLTIMLSWKGCWLELDGG